MCSIPQGFYALRLRGEIISGAAYEGELIGRYERRIIPTHELTPLSGEPIRRNAPASVGETPLRSTDHRRFFRAADD
jgi:hypothetical protein